MPGYGWIFPLGDGRVNAGVGLLSAEGRWKGVNTTQLMDAFVDCAPESWGLSPETSLRAAHRRQAPHGPVGRSARRRQRRSPSATPPGRSTRSTARASPTATRPAGWPRPRSARRSAGEGEQALVDYERSSRRLRPLLQDGPGLRPPDQHPELMRVCVGPGMHSERSWSGCCASWPTWCGPTRSVRPRSATGRSSSSPDSSPTPRSRESGRLSCGLTTGGGSQPRRARSGGVAAWSKASSPTGLRRSGRRAGAERDARGDAATNGVSHVRPEPRCLSPA